MLLDSCHLPSAWTLTKDMSWNVPIRPRDSNSYTAISKSNASWRLFCYFTAKVGRFRQSPKRFDMECSLCFCFSFTWPVKRTHPFSRDSEIAKALDHFSSIPHHPRRCYTFPWPWQELRCLNQSKITRTEGKKTDSYAWAAELSCDWQLSSGELLGDVG